MELLTYKILSLLFITLFLISNTEFYIKNEERKLKIKCLEKIIESDNYFWKKVSQIQESRIRILENFLKGANYENHKNLSIFTTSLN